jgi:hypothetical protein
VGGVEMPVAFANAKDEDEAVALIKPRWPASRLLLGGGASGAFRAQAAYTAPLADVQRMALIAQTELIANTMSNSAVTAQALQEIAGFVKAGMAQAVRGH